MLQEVAVPGAAVITHTLFAGQMGKTTVSTTLGEVQGKLLKHQTPKKHFVHIEVIIVYMRSLVDCIIDSSIKKELKISAIAKYSVLCILFYFLVTISLV